MSEPTPDRHPSLVVHYLGRAERILLTMVAVVLVALAVLLLANSVKSMVEAVINKSVSTLSIEILDGVLLVMMTMEIVYTVTLSLQSHKLVAEPFLIIGIIAAIRRTLVITAESTNLQQPTDSAAVAAAAEAFRSTLLELALLALIVGVLSVSIYIIRRSQAFAPSDDETRLKDD